MDNGLAYRKPPSSETFSTDVPLFHHKNTGYWPAGVDSGNFSVYQARDCYGSCMSRHMPNPLKSLITRRHKTMKVVMPKQPRLSNAAQHLLPIAVH
jgi:hypothetical protein